MIKPLVAALLLTAACIDAPDLETADQDLGPGEGGTRETQGRYVLGQVADPLLGTRPDTFTSTPVVGVKGVTSTSFSIVPGASTCLRATIGGIVRECTALAFNGYVFPIPGGSLAITGSVQFTTTEPVRSVVGYLLEYRPSAGPPTAYCARNHLAYPVMGELWHNGALDPISRITWACSEYLPSGVKDTDPLGNGVFAKAISWGFVAGLSLHSTTGVPVTSAELQLSATRMGRADYCFDGDSNTLEATPIAYMDLVPGNLVLDASGPIGASPADSAALVDSYADHFEAVWPKPSPSGLPGGQLVDNGRPLCLSKLRWSMLPPGDLCGGTVRDPRLHPDAKFCEDYTNYEALSAAGGMIVNASRFTDLGLRVWSTSTDHFTTTRGADNGFRPGTPPAPGFDFEQLLGTLVTTSGSEIWDDAYGPSGGVFEPLVVCRRTTAPVNERITTTASKVPPAYGNCVEEGHVWTVPPAPSVQAALGLNMLTLTRYRSNVGTDFFTTTGGTPPGYGNPVFLGYIVAPRYL